jgi:hypothetical protein
MEETMVRLSILKRAFTASVFSIVMLILLIGMIGLVSGEPRSIGGYQVYYGDLHNHTQYDPVASGTPAEAFAYARDNAKLDFFGLSEHSNVRNTGMAKRSRRASGMKYLQPEEWDDIQNAANAANSDNEFVTFYGIEWTNDQLGHITIINTDDYCYSDESPTNTFEGICSWISDRNDCVAFFNHPGRYNGSDEEFSHFNGMPVANIVGIELWNKTEGFSSFWDNSGYDDQTPTNYYEEVNSYGWKIGAAGGGDNHSRSWGTAQDYRLAVLASNLTRGDLLAAMRARRFYSTLDNNLALSFTINGSQMGSTRSGGSNQPCQILATDGDGNETFTNVRIYNSNHEIVASWTPNTNAVNISTSITTSLGEYYYVYVEQADRDAAISSPIWISGKALVWQYNGNSIQYWPMDSGVPSTGIDIATVENNQFLRGIGDVNGDGSDEFVWQNSDGLVYYWQIQHGKMADSFEIAPAENDQILRGIGDLNGDGTDDLVWQAPGGLVYYWSMEQGKMTDDVDLETRDGSWSLNAVGDMNGDGTDDIIWQNSQGAVQFWAMENGAVNGTIKINKSRLDGWVLKAAADLNGDNSADLIWQNSNGLVHFWPMINGKRTDDIDIATVNSGWNLCGVGNFK